MKKLGVFVGIAAVVAIAVFLQRGPQAPSTSTDLSTNSVAPPEKTVSPGTNEPKANPSAMAAGASPTVTMAPALRVMENAPTLEQAREEVGINPHTTPPSLISFARALGPRMEQAMKSPESANTLFAELEECAASPRGQLNPSAQALCLVDMRKLAQTYPSLSERAKTATENAPPGARRLAH